VHDTRAAQAILRPALRDPRWFRWALIGACALFLMAVLVLPLCAVLHEAFRRGIGPAFSPWADPDTLAATRLTLQTAAWVVPLNALFGIAAGYALGKFRFRGRTLLIALIDLPLSVSPVIAGMLFVLLFGAQGWFGPWLREHEIKILFAPTGIVLATLFVTFPIVARELIAVMEVHGREEEEAALSLGASAWTTFWRVTLPSARWALLLGIVLCNARAMGDFGAVSVVSGHIRGETNTLPLHVEVLYGEYQFQAAFAVAFLLILMAVATILVKHLVEHRASRPATLEIP
jgi:sulfate transport system permease protein